MRYNFNEKIDRGATLEEITNIINNMASGITGMIETEKVIVDIFREK